MDTLLENYAGKKGSMIPLLQGTQDIYGYVPKVAIEKISNKTGLSISTVKRRCALNNLCVEAKQLLRDGAWIC